jgi:hypothetical protein
MPTENRSSNTKTMAGLPPFAQKVISKLRRFEQCSSDGQGADIGRHWFDLLVQLGLLNRTQHSPALWEITQQGEDLLESQPADRHKDADALTFEFLHPLTKERRTVTLTKADVADGMEDTFYEKLGDQLCPCEPVGETNVVDCNCDEYCHEFDLVADSASAEPEVTP